MAALTYLRYKLSSDIVKALGTILIVVRQKMPGELLLLKLQSGKFLNAMLADEEKISLNRAVLKEGFLTICRIKKPGYPPTIIEIGKLSAGLKPPLLDTAGDKAIARHLLPENVTTAARAA